MDTQTPASLTESPFFNPLAGWEAASRWNAATLDWMTRGFQQWLALVTTVPPQLLPLAGHEVVPAATRRVPEAPQAPTRIALRHEEARAVASEEPRRRARPKAAARTRNKSRG